MWELLDHSLVTANELLDWRNSKQPRVQLSVFLSGIAFNVVELHARQAALCWFDMNFEVFVTNGAELVAAVMHHVVAAAMAFTQDEECSLIDSVSNPVIRYRFADASHTRRRVIE